VSSLRIDDRAVLGQSVEIVSGQSRLRAEIGVDLGFLQSLTAPPPERGERLEAFARELPPDWERARRVREPGRVHEEAVRRDGVGILFEQGEGLAEGEPSP
jgi:hypothetical protein